MIIESIGNSFPFLFAVTNEICRKQATEIVKKTCSYTNHTVMPEALEKWSIELFGSLLPRHLELIIMTNEYFMSIVKEKVSNSSEMLSALSLIEEGTPQKVRMANLVSSPIFKKFI